jgi:2-hydroxychromene-2-carboxylate isomerase
MIMSKVIDTFIFTQSPWAYLGHARLVQMAQRHGATIDIKPMDAAKVFPVSGGTPLAQRPAQRRTYRMIELKRWRDYLNVPLNPEPKFFPVAGDPAARLIVAARALSGAAAVELAGRVLAAVWAQERNIADEDSLRLLADEAGLDGRALLARSRTADIQAQYEALTQEAIDRQVFGAPSYVYRGELFWGQDRLDFLDRALAA